ncbi:unnamed protein product [Arabis nemorensis]|uniref:Uncharacterized protein n=1 Tax=Arabis nemorensis TaxID=586526 RepID=A0A565BD27_9BRAS|nr:unnamed protein product [Arabis nemorensis]
MRNVRDGEKQNKTTSFGDGASSLKTEVLELKLFRESVFVIQILESHIPAKDLRSRREEKERHGGAPAIGVEESKDQALSVSRSRVTRRNSLSQLSSTVRSRVHGVLKSASKRCFSSNTFGDSTEDRVYLAPERTNPHFRLRFFNHRVLRHVFVDLARNQKLERRNHIK